MNAGPTLLVPLPRGHASAVAEALGRIPRLGDIRGNIAMVNIGAIGVDCAQDAWLRSQIGPVDETLYLAMGEHDGLDPRAVYETLAAILGKATELGMISGRGVVSFRPGQQGPLAASAR
ncbi:MAG: hypothetical protein JJU07_07280 [Natronohydrobacter sp.]|nr:hypothetical protein [Natronohydrobacter sp.]